jgi:hypothetical protein
LRDMSHNNEIRVIASAFQEVVVKQIQNPQGPFVNFGNTLKVHSFTKNEIDELLIAPLQFWGLIRDKRELGNTVKRNFGSHPLILQYLGNKLFEKIADNANNYVDDIIDSLLEVEELSFFETAVEDIYLKIDSYLERYVFLKLCIDIDLETKDLSAIAINQERLYSLLEGIGIESDLDSRTMLLDRLSLRGLLSQDVNSRLTYRIDGPIIYRYLKNFYHPIHTQLKNYLNEIKIKKLSVNEF